jgi:hypothetical protein
MRWFLGKTYALPEGITDSTSLNLSDIGEGFYRVHARGVPP